MRGRGWKSFIGVGEMEIDVQEQVGTAKGESREGKQGRRGVRMV